MNRKPLAHGALLMDAARTLADVSDARAEITSSVLSSEAIAGVSEHVANQRYVQDLPTCVIGAMIGRVPVLIGELDAGSDEASIIDSLRRFRNQATIARSWLGAAAQNLHLFLVGPLGSFADAHWLDLAQVIEADDRVCRKLVWLPATNPSVEDAGEFLNRTFLARPWEAQQNRRIPQLDRMSSIELPPGWLDILRDYSLDADAIVARIIEVSE